MPEPGGHAGEDSGRGGARKARSNTNSLALFLAGSVAVHATVIGVLPGFLTDRGPPLVELEVTLVKPEPLPVAPPEPETPPPPRRKVEPQRKPDSRTAVAKAPSAPQPEPPAPVLAIPSSQAPAESAFNVPAAKPVESAPPPAPKAQVATAAVSPPTFNAAYLRNPAPRYPLAARRAGEQGTVMLRVLVTPEGAPARVELEKSSGSSHLDSAAVDAVKGWRFTPARRGAEAVEGWVLVPIVFRLEG